MEPCVIRNYPQHLRFMYVQLQGLNKLFYTNIQIITTRMVNKMQFQLYVVDHPLKHHILSVVPPWLSTSKGAQKRHGIKSLLTKKTTLLQRCQGIHIIR